MRRVFFGIAVLAVLAVGAWLSIRTPTPEIYLRNVVAHPVPGAPHTAMVTLTIENRGGPDVLVEASSATARLAFVKALKTRGIPVPADSSPELSMEAGHIMLMGLEAPLSPGMQVPFSIRFARSGEMEVSATVAGPHMDLRPPRNLPDPALAPAVTLTAVPDGDGWRIRVATERFAFSGEAADGAGAPWTGYGLLYIDAAKMGRVSMPDTRLNRLPQGSHTVELVLYTNDDRTYALDGVPISAEVEIKSP